MSQQPPLPPDEGAVPGNESQAPTVRSGRSSGGLVAQLTRIISDGHTRRVRANQPGRRGARRLRRHVALPQSRSCGRMVKPGNDVAFEGVRALVQRGLKRRHSRAPRPDLVQAVPVYSQRRVLLGASNSRPR
jgi:hypothetical protein